GVKEKVTEAAREATARAKQRASDVAAQAKDTATDIMQDQKVNVADRIGGYGAALQETADSLQDEDPNIAWAARSASERLQRAADYFRTSNLRQMRDDAADLPRRHPIAFFGGMFVAGALVGAALKAGASSVAHHRQREFAGDDGSYGESDLT